MLKIFLLLWKCFCAARDLYAFSLLLHAMTIYYSIQIAGKLSFYSFKKCLYALQHVYLYILGREVPMYTISIQTQQKKNSYVIVISCHDNEVGNFSAFLLFKPNGGLWHGKCAMKWNFPMIYSKSHLFGNLLSIIYDDYTHWLAVVDVLNF